MIKKGASNILILILFVVLSSAVNGQGGAARLRCVNVLANGDVIMQWIPETSEIETISYVLYHSPAIAGPYNKLDSITIISQDTYTHIGAGANNAPQYYYMVIYRLAGVSPPSDTLATIYLQSSTTDFEIIDLSWTAIHNPFTPSMHPWYLLYREYPPGNFMLTDSTQGLSISHHFYECNENSDTVRFRIGVRDNETGCISFSNRTGEVMKNLTNRFPPVIDSVSIDANGHAIIGWQAGTEPDIMGYTIFSVSATNDSIAYVDGISSTSFTHLASIPCEGPLSYILLSIDSCGNESPFPFDPITFNDKPHNTIYLEDIGYDPCLMNSTLTWNGYQNFDPPLEGYRIYVSIANGPFQLLQTAGPAQHSFVHEGLTGNTSYAYYIRAFTQGDLKTSTSCTQQMITYNSPGPEYMYMRYVSVENNEQVNILFYTDTSAHAQFYRILRSEFPGGPYEEIGTVEEAGSESISFTDLTAAVNARSYHYQVEVIDSCGMASVIANTSKTILLTVEALQSMENVLAWNAYESWDGAVAGYRIYRRLNDSPTLELIYTAGASELTYSDDVSDLTGSVSRITYLVEAFEGAGNAFGFQESSFSNEALAEQESRIYVPNALLPNGINNILKPVGVFVNSDGYEFIIYNRWGQQVFRTADPSEGWDGTYNGRYAEGGVYVYLVRFRDALDQLKIQKGNVAVIY